MLAEKVLVAEDEPILRMAAATMLEDAGFDVIEVASAAQALAILETRTDIQLVFSDIDMPDGIDGVRLAALIRDRWPPIEIILTSGHMAPAVASLPPRCIFLPKPYRSTEVIEALRNFGKARRDQV